MPTVRKRRSDEPKSVTPPRLPPSLNLKIEVVPIGSLAPYAGNARTHSKKQIAQISASIRQFGFVSPILRAEDGTVLAGHGRLAAAVSMGLESVPTIQLDHLTSEERRAYVIADNRLAELAGWDRALLSLELQALEALDLDFTTEITGFDGAELDRLLDLDVLAEASPEDRIPEVKGPAVTAPGDLWLLGPHRLICGDARDPGVHARLMGADAARLVFTDPPYNVKIDGNVGGKGKIARREFAMASGEMSPGEFTQFLTDALSAAAESSCDGSIHYVCMDWAHLGEVIAAGKAVYDAWKMLIVWAKTNAGMGTFYRSQHELILVFKKGSSPHVNSFGLGETGRYRTNLWTYPGMNSFGAGRDAALSWHATVKPVALVADAIRDVSRRKDIVLDPFGGSGTTLIAAEKTGRRARLMEIDTHYCDVICRRWTAFTGQPATLDQTGETFEQVQGRRQTEAGHDT